MQPPRIATREEWLEARLALLEKEKAHSRARDALTRARQGLPWVRLEKDYVFDGSKGAVALADLFDGKSQLIVYHFMFGPDWDAGCKACSWVADHYNPAIIHLAHRDTALAAVSRAPFEKLQAFKKRMGWDFTWVSSLKSDFNRDFDVSFSEEEIAGDVYYNFRNQRFPSTEAPGVSVLAKGDDGAVYHTYSAYERGLENLIGTYHLLDIVPKGRDEDGLSYDMEWLRLKDEYENGA